MKRDKKIFAIGINDTIEPTTYLWGIIEKCNNNIIDDKEDFLEGLELQEIQDLIIYHTDSYILSQKASTTAKKWMELYNKYM